MSEDDFIWGNDFQEEGIFGHVQSSLGNRGEQRAAVQHDKENNSLMLQGSCPTTIPAYKGKIFPLFLGKCGQLLATKLYVGAATRKV